MGFHAGLKVFRVLTEVQEGGTVCAPWYLST